MFFIELEESDNQSDWNLFWSVVTDCKSAPSDWIKWRTNDGKQHITYDASVKTVEQAKEKKYTNVEEVVSQGLAHNSDYSEVVELGAGGNYRVNGGERKDIDDESILCGEGH